MSGTISYCLDARGHAADCHPDRCEICRWAQSQGTPRLSCRRRAPIAVEPVGGVYYARWPDVDPQQWCGEFELRSRPVHG